MRSEPIRIGDFTIGKDGVFIIGEVGSNHCQSLSLAKETIDMAAEAGANAVKFQSIRLDRLYLQPSAETRALHALIDFPEEWHAELRDYCAKKNVIFFSSPTYPEALEILEKINVPLYKLASAQVGTFPQMVDKVAALNKPVILSTGLVEYGSLSAVIDIFRRAGNNRYMILHCNSIYPVPENRVNLPLMEVYRSMFQCPVGFSDHSDGYHVAVAAVSLGASILEKHITMDRKLKSPDAAFAADPGEFREYCEKIRRTEELLIHHPRLHIEPEEETFRNRITTRLVAGRNMQAGESLSPADVEFLRHPEGIDCREAERAFGRRLKKSVSTREVLHWDDLEI